MKATFGAGCFWHVEAAFRKVGFDVTVGYMGGSLDNPSYEDVCTGMTGHAEVAQVEYDPEKHSYKELLDIFWNCHDPTQMNRQGPDVGMQYRSVIFYHTDEQKNLAEQSRKELQKEREIMTVIEPAKEFFKAEEYHQNYFEKNGQACGL